MKESLDDEGIRCVYLVSKDGGGVRADWLRLWVDGKKYPVD